VFVPAYNEEYLVYASLERIEVIVVDDGSTDQTPSVLREFERSICAEPNAKMKWVFLRHESTRVRLPRSARRSNAPQQS
jgi:glycosyltransferase involved in cell wall biosynthesis